MSTLTIRLERGLLIHLKGETGPVLQLQSCPLNDECQSLDRQYVNKRVYSSHSVHATMNMTFQSLLLLFPLLFMPYRIHIFL